MTRDEVPQTIEEAEAQMWHGLTVYCHCKHQAMRSWLAIRARTDERRLARIIPMLRCGTCKGQPYKVTLTAVVPARDYVREKEIIVSGGEVRPPGRE